MAAGNPLVHEQTAATFLGKQTAAAAAAAASMGEGRARKGSWGIGGAATRLAAARKGSWG